MILYKYENKNFAFVDGQNLYMNTAKRETDPWKVNLARFRVYLEKNIMLIKPIIF